jgi:hypothetical protein
MEPRADLYYSAEERRKLAVARNRTPILDRPTCSVVTIRNELPISHPNLYDVRKIKKKTFRKSLHFRLKYALVQRGLASGNLDTYTERARFESQPVNRLS